MDVNLLSKSLSSISNLFIYPHAKFSPQKHKLDGVLRRQSNARSLEKGNCFNLAMEDFWGTKGNEYMCSVHVSPQKVENGAL